MTRWAAFAFPIWILGFPSVMYWHDRASGLIPTQSEWESAAHSSGPWQATLGLVLLGSFVLGCFLHFFAIATFLQLQQRRTATYWVIGGLFGLLSSALSFYLFG